MPVESRWIPVAERLPAPAETLDGRVPAIDEDGYLVCALVIGGQLLCSSDMPAICWMPVPQRPDIV